MLLILFYHLEFIRWKLYYQLRSTRDAAEYLEGIPFYQSLYPTCHWWCILLLSSTVLLFQKGTACPDAVNIQGLRPARCSTCMGGTATMCLNSRRDVITPGSWHVNKYRYLSPGACKGRVSGWVNIQREAKHVQGTAFVFRRIYNTNNAGPCMVSGCTFVHESAHFLNHVSSYLFFRFCHNHRKFYYTILTIIFTGTKKKSLFTF